MSFLWWGGGTLVLPLLLGCSAETVLIVLVITAVLFFD